MRIGPWWVQLYTLRITIGTILGLAWLWWQGTHVGIRQHELLSWVLAVIVVALLSGRLGYIIGQPYFAQHPQAILHLRTAGGLHGGSSMAGGLLVLLLWGAVKSRRFADLLALWSPAVLVVAAGAWWGCREVGCAWGVPAVPGDPWRDWLIVKAPDLYHIQMQRYSIQTLGAVWAGVMALLALALGDKGGMALALYCAGSALLTFQRGDPVPMVNDVRVDTLHDIGLALIISTGVLYPARSSRKKALRN